MTSGQVRTVTNSLDAGSILRRVSTRWRAPALAAGVIVVAGVCTLVLPITRPQYDPYGWLLWGREITNGSPPFSTVDYPSWKPLAALLTTPIALAGSAAPTVWLVVERALALAGLVLAYVIGARLAGRAAGLLAAIAVVLVSGWLLGALDGHLEATTALLLLAAALLDSQGRVGAAVAALSLAGLARPDAWLVLGVYLVVVVAERPRRRWPLTLALVAVAALWFGGDAIGSGSA